VSVSYTPCCTGNDPCDRHLPKEVDYQTCEHKSAEIVETELDRLYGELVIIFECSDCGAATRVTTTARDLRQAMTDLDNPLVWEMDGYPIQRPS
jgi:hypothetical protein